MFGGNEMLQRSMVEVAYELLSKKQGPQKFAKFWDEVSDVLAMDNQEKDQNISKFYTKLTLDERFVLLEDNTWDLRERQSFDKVHIDMNDIYSELEDEEKELEAEKEEDKIYDDESESDSEEDEDGEERHREDDEDEDNDEEDEEEDY
jgi:DNA-directed RNA polymerase delta subunit